MSLIYAHSRTRSAAFSVTQPLVWTSLTTQLLHDAQSRTIQNTLGTEKVAWQHHSAWGSSQNIEERKFFLGLYDKMAGFLCLLFHWHTVLMEWYYCSSWWWTCSLDDLIVFEDVSFFSLPPPRVSLSLIKWKQCLDRLHGDVIEKTNCSYSSSSSSSSSCSSSLFIYSWRPDPAVLCWRISKVHFNLNLMG